jgi:expansin
MYAIEAARRIFQSSGKLSYPARWRRDEASNMMRAPLRAAVVSLRSAIAGSWVPVWASALALSLGCSGVFDDATRDKKEADTGSGGTSAGTSSVGGSGGTVVDPTGGTGGSLAAGTGGTDAGGSTMGGSAGTGGSAPSCVADTTTYTGHATWYEVPGERGACQYPYGDYVMYGAMNEDDYRAASACGTCARVNAEGKTLDIKIIDLCPYVGNEEWCWAGSHHIDLSPGAFLHFAPHEQGVLEITWQYIPCEVTGGLTYEFKGESSQYWSETLVDNYPYEIKLFEYDAGGSNFISVPRTDYNQFQAGEGMGPGPFTFRVTDIYDRQVTDTGIPLTPGATQTGTSNFPLCQ